MSLQHTDLTWTLLCFSLLKQTAFLRMLTGILWAAFDPVGNVRSWWAEKFPATVAETEQYPVGIACPPPLSFPSQNSASSPSGETSTEKQGDQRSNLQYKLTHRAVYLHTQAFIPAATLCRLQHTLALSQNLTFPSNYRCFSLLAVWNWGYFLLTLPYV